MLYCTYLVRILWAVARSYFAVLNILFLSWRFRTTGFFLDQDDLNSLIFIFWWQLRYNFSDDMLRFYMMCFSWLYINVSLCVFKYLVRLGWDSDHISYSNLPSSMILWNAIIYHIFRLHTLQVMPSFTLAATVTKYR